MITEWAAAFTENIIALSAVALAAGKKKGHNKYILYLSALSFAATIIIRIMNQIESFSYITAVLAILISVLGAKFLSSGSVWIRLSAAILTFTVIYSVDYIVVALMGFFSGASENFFLCFCHNARVVAHFISCHRQSLRCSFVLWFKKKAFGVPHVDKALAVPAFGA